MLRAAFALISVSLGAAELTIDHVTAAGKDLKTMQAGLAAMGIPCEYGGPHKNRATEMALASFPDGSYLELIAIQPKADSLRVPERSCCRQRTEYSLEPSMQPSPPGRARIALNRARQTRL